MPYSLDKVKILIVDDMHPMLSLCTSVLKIFGFEALITASNGKKAFEEFCRHDPDLVLTDWVMNPVDGLELARMIRTDPMSPNPYVPIVMMTGYSSRLRVEKARDVGITEFLVKPFTSRDLYSRISQVIEKPRQFVDVGEFFGPDRRRKASDGYQGKRKRDEDKEPSKTYSQNEKDILKKLKEEAKKVS